MSVMEINNYFNSLSDGKIAALKPRGKDRKLQLFKDSTAAAILANVSNGGFYYPTHGP